MSTAPLTYTSAYASEVTGVAEETVRKIVRQECAALVPDELRFIPGGRVDGRVLVIWAGIFDAVISGRAVTRTAPVTSISTIQRRNVA